jgi:signal peptide peptidase SppA
VTEARKFAPSDPLALEPRAFGMFLLMPYEPVTIDRGGVTVLSVRGPLQQFHDPFCDSYESIARRVEGAIANAPRAIVLSIASPGGLVSGVFEAADRIRTMCAAAGVPLYAYVDGAACSAAYALACAASRIVAPTTGSVGSIGVIAECVDASAQLAQMGVRVDLLTSGSHKADGNPHVKSEHAAAARIQAKVDDLAELFFAYVSQRRPINVDDVRALDAGVFLGAKARELGLIDDVQTLEELLAVINASTATNEGTDMKASKAYEDAIAALRKAAESDDEKEAARAKRMLAAELAEDEDEPEKDDEEAKAEDEDEPEKDDEEAKASAKAAAASVSASTTGEIAGRLSTLERRLERQERAEIFATRPDLAPGLVKLLSTKPVAEVRAIVSAIKPPPKPKLGDHAAAEQVAGTRGDQLGAELADQQRPEAVSAMDRAMGLSATKIGVKREGTRLFLGASLPADAK